MSITKAQSFHFLWASFSSCPCCCRRAPQAELAFSQTDKILLLPLKLPFFCLFVFLWLEKSSVECFTGYWVSARFRRGASKYSWGTGRSRIWVCLEHLFSPFQDPATTSSGSPHRSQATGTRWRGAELCAPSLPWTGQSHPTTTALVRFYPTLREFRGAERFSLPLRCFLASFLGWHSFLLPSGMTENYIIFIEQPLKLNLLKIITSKLCGKAIYDGINWEPQHNTYFHVVNKHTGEVRGSLPPAGANLEL